MLCLQGIKPLLCVCIVKTMPHKEASDHLHHLAQKAVSPSLSPFLPLFRSSFCLTWTLVSRFQVQSVVSFSSFVTCDQIESWNVKMETLEVSILTGMELRAVTDSGAFVVHPTWELTWWVIPILEFSVHTACHSPHFASWCKHWVSLHRHHKKGKDIQ